MVKSNIQTAGILLIAFFTVVSLGCAERRPWPPVEKGIRQKPPTSEPVSEQAGGLEKSAEKVSEQNAAPQQYTGVYHEVKPGDTLWRIAKTYGVDLETLQWVNDVEDVTDLRIGRVLFIPGAERLLEIIPFTPEEEAPPLIKKIGVLWPIKGRLTSRFGMRGKRMHEGIDLAAPKGTPVHAAAAGKVVYSGAGMKGYGKVVVVKHGSEFSTVYAHNSSLLVKMGERVEEKQVIARVGSTGWATGPHLHFEVRRRGVPEDPLEYLPAP